MVHFRARSLGTPEDKTDTISANIEKSMAEIVG